MSVDILETQVIIKNEREIDIVSVGIQGVPGIGVPAGGTTGQVLKKVSGTNFDTAWQNESGQTSIVGITGTKAQFNAAVTDGDILYVGDVTQYSDELTQDAIGGILVDSSEINFTYNDATPSITADIVAGSIDKSKLDTSVNASLDLADSAAQTSFTTIAVAGQSNVVSDTNSDTLTLVAGPNITITTNATTDSVTISGTGGSGGSPAGSNTEIQFNNAGSFGSSPDFTYSTATGLVESSNVSGWSTAARLQNTSTTTNSGQRIEFYHMNAGSLIASGYIGARGWINGNQHGELVISGSANGLLSAAVATLDVNGLFTAPTVRASVEISANNIGLNYSSGGPSITHGLWAADHLDMGFKWGGITRMTGSWEGKLGLGFATRTGMNGLFHVKAINTTFPTMIVQAFASQTADLTQWQNSAGTNLLTVKPNGDIAFTGTGSVTSQSGGSTTVGAPNGSAYIGNTTAFGASMLVNSNGTKLVNNIPFGWSSDATSFGAYDTAIRRSAAGIIEVNNGTSGQLRDLLTRNVSVNEEAYGATWDSSTNVPTKNAVYDKIQTLCQTAITFGGVAPSNDTIYITSYASFAGTINSIQNIQTSSGTITVNVQINGVSVTGLSAVAVNSTSQDVTATGANTFAIGAEITVILSSNSSSANLRGTLLISQ